MFKQILKGSSARITSFFLVESFACIKTRLAIALSKLWHTVPLIRCVSNYSIILVPYLSSSNYFGISVLLTN